MSLVRCRDLVRRDWMRGVESEDRLFLGTCSMQVFIDFSCLWDFDLGVRGFGDSGWCFADAQGSEIEALL